jgi:ribonuclease J
MSNFKIRYVALGGVGDVTKNMHVYELYQNDKLKDILIVDCGIGFPAEKELGIDFVIPDISYLEDKKDKIKAIILSHGHEDHTSSLPFHYAALGQPPVFASKLTAIFSENKLKEHGISIKINQVNPTKTYRFGDFEVLFIKMTHSIPDTLHLFIKTPVGNFYHGQDFKLDLTPPYGPPPEFEKITQAGKEGVLCLLSDCLGAEREGLTLSEKVVGKTFEDEMRKTKGKFIMTTFSSNISRIRQCVEAAVKFNRKIVFLGRSMKENTRLAIENGYLPIPPSFLIKEEETKRFPPQKLCLIVAGSQGQYDSALAKLSMDQNPNIKITPGDKVIFSSDPIPGNENDVYGLIEDLIEKGAEVIYSEIGEQLHSSGHGNQEDLKFLIRFTKPKYFIPIGGTVRHQKQYQKIVADLGFDKDLVFLLKEGESVWFFENKAFLGEKIETKNIYVDAYGVGDVGNIVLRDRKTLATEGMVIVFLIFDNQGRLLTAPKIISRGFVFEKEEKKLYQKAKDIIEILTKPHHHFHPNEIKRVIIDSLEDLFYQEKGRKPLVVVETIVI